MADFPPKVNVAAEPQKKTATGWTSGMLKGTRASVLKAIAESGLTDAEKNLLTEKVGKVDVGYDLIQVHFHQHPYNAGNNGGWTVMEL